MKLQSFTFYSDALLASYRWGLAAFILLSIILFGNEELFFGYATLLCAISLSCFGGTLSWQEMQRILREESSLNSSQFYKEDSVLYNSPSQSRSPRWSRNERKD